MIKFLEKDKIELSSNLSENFDIQLANKIDEFSTEFATAYNTISRKPSGDGAQYYALVYNNTFPVDLDRLNALKNIESATVQKLLDVGKIRGTNNNEILAAIFERPKGQKLSDIVQQKGAVDEQLLAGIFVPKIASAIDRMHENQIFHGNLCLEKIYYDNTNAKITVIEASGAYPGFYQSSAYETIERMVCHKAAKSYREFEADYYALGVCLNELVFGDRAFLGIPNMLAHKMKLENGSYESVFTLSKTKTNITVSSRTEILLRGLMHDKPKDRWGSNQISAWLKKKIGQVVPSRVHKHASSGFLYNGANYFSSKLLAHSLFEDWEGARKSLKISDLSRWLSANSRFPDIERKLFIMTQGWQSEVILPDDKITRIIYLLDDNGPIRFKNISLHPDGLGNLFNYLYSNPNEENDKYLELVSNAIDLGFLEGWISIQENKDLYKPTYMGYNPRRIKFFLRNYDIGFGIERCIYETNPYLSCQSKLLGSNFVLGLAQTLSLLERTKLPVVEDEFDKHLMAYLCCKCEIDDSIKVKQLRNLPYYSKSKKLKTCAIFALAQKRAGILSLPNIADWLKRSTESLIGKLYSSNIREKLSENVSVATKTGNLSAVFQSIADSKLITRDIYGFQEAKKQYKILNFQKLKLKSQKSLDQIAIKIGLRISVVFSYVICSTVFVIITFLKLN